AQLAFASGMKIDVIPWSIGPMAKLLPPDIARLEAAAAGNPLVTLLVKWLHDFWKHVPGKTNMYDPMTVVAMHHPEFFDWHTGRVTVELRDNTKYGLTRFEPHPAGSHRVAMSVDADKARGFMIDRICSVV